MFLQLEQQVEKWDSDEARNKFVAHLEKMDATWDRLLKLNASVMTTLIASTTPSCKGTSRELCEGILTLMGKMCDAWAYVAGNVIASPPEQAEVFEESQTVDKIGMKLGKNADRFLIVIMSQLMYPLMMKWSEIFMLVAEARTMSADSMSPADANLMSSSCSEEVRKAYVAYRLELTLGLAVGSDQLIEASTWAAKARPRFEKLVRDWGQSQEVQAMAAVIRELGIPHGGHEHGC